MALAMHLKLISDSVQLFGSNLLWRRFAISNAKVPFRTLRYSSHKEYYKEQHTSFTGKRYWNKYKVIAVGGSLLFPSLLSDWNAVYAFSKDDKGDVIGNIPPRLKYNFIADVVEKVAPAVVFIGVKELHPFLGTVINVGSGSGFLVDSNGLVLTNAHVVGNNKNVIVRLYDERTVKGVVEFIDNNCDLATIRINEKNLPCLKFGKSSEIRSGEWVIAIGSPFCLTNTITAGVVSSSNRQFTVNRKGLGILNDEMKYIQTDAAMNNGNSGGPLVNLDAEVIGVNSKKVSVAAGISFAIPSDYVKTFLQRAQSAKSVQKSNIAKSDYLGLSMLTLNRYIAKQLQQQKLNFPEVEQGILIIKVNPGSPSETAGLQAEDVIVAVNGKPAMTPSEIYNYLNTGTKMTLTVLRRTDKINITIVPEEII